MPNLLLEDESHTELVATMYTKPYGKAEARTGEVLTCCREANNVLSSYRTRVINTVLLIIIRNRNFYLVNFFNKTIFI